jgi:hypothetical protein
VEAPDALEVLGLPGPAGPDEVKQAYRRLARELHPDAGGDAEEFRRVQEAYQAISGGTDARADGPRAQVRVAGVDQRWWETPGAWHEGPVDVAAVDLGRAPEGRVTPATVDLVASLLHAPGAPPVRPVSLHSRAPGSRLHAIVGWLQPELLASLTARPTTDGPRAGHDVHVELRAAAGRGRRLAADAPLPAQWTRRRGSDSVRIARDLRPSRDPAATAVRVTREMDELTATMGWPMGEWFVLR